MRAVSGLSTKTSRSRKPMIWPDPGAVFCRKHSHSVRSRQNQIRGAAKRRPSCSGVIALRRIFATLPGAERKGTLKDVQKQLRHARPDTTLENYVKEIT